MKDWLITAVRAETSTESERRLDMYRKEEIEAYEAKEKELMEQLDSLKEEFELKKLELEREYKSKILNLEASLRVTRIPLRHRRYYEKTYGAVKEPKPKMTPEELREYNRIKQREYRAKRKKMMEESK